MNVIGFKEAKCKNCYKCIRTCEVKAISMKDEQAQIINDACILCGQCLDACPQNAKTFISDLDQVKEYIRQGKTVVASLAPSYLGVLPYQKLGQVITALKKLGFYKVRETAEGAAIVTREYETILQQGQMRNIITTCCPSVNELVEKYYPALVPFMAPVVSPMIAHGKILRQELGQDIKVVFIGPCIAKKREAESDDRTIGAVDAVLHFSELEGWFQEEGICLSDCEESEPDNKNPQVNRLYPVTSGVIASVMVEKAADNHYQMLHVDGIRNCMELFESLLRGEIEGCFIEANSCEGGCVHGPMLDNGRAISYKARLQLEKNVEKVAPKELLESLVVDSHDFHKQFLNRKIKAEIPTQEQIAHILKKIGKTRPEHMLNCGACGYPSCRDKAIAVFQKKAELYMCIPFMHEKAQSMSNVVMDTTPNLIIMVDSEMRIVEMNKAAIHQFQATNYKANEQFLYEFIDTSDFESVLQSHSSILGKRVTYDAYHITTLQNIVYVKDQNNVLGVFQDISAQEEQQQQAYKVKVETIEMAQKVIDKQMMVAQQIAGLLGETTAETKVTLTKLRDTILYDGEEKKSIK